MSKLTKIMLGMTILNAMLSGLILAKVINANIFPRFDVVFPLTAIFYGMFLIVRMLQNDVAEYHAEQRNHHDHPVSDHRSDSAESLRDHQHHEPMEA